MVLIIDFNSNEAIYIQFRNQITLEITTERVHEGDSLSPVRQLVGNIGINIYTVNKAYSVLRQEDFVKPDRRRGAAICLDVDKLQALEEVRQRLAVVPVIGIYKDINWEEVHQIVDEIYDIFQNGEK